MDNSEEIKLVQLLYKILKDNKKIAQFDSENEPGGWRLAYSLSEIEKSCSTFYNKLLPKLKKTNKQEDIEKILHEIGEEFRHLLYHIEDSKYYSYLFDEDDQNKH